MPDIDEPPRWRAGAEAPPSAAPRARGSARAAAARARALLELFARTSGAAAAALAIPLFGGVGLSAAILFPRNGLSAHDVVSAERGSFAARAALWTGWVVLSVPPARALLGAPSAAWLRSLPVGRAPFLALLTAALLALQTPWIALFARDRGIVAGLGAGLLAAALAAGLASLRAMRWHAAALLLPLAAVAVPLPLGPSLALALPACCLAAHAGFFRGIALPRGGLRLVRGPAPLALAGVLVARLVRGERAAVARSLLAALAGGALGAVGARNNERLGDGFPWLVLPIATLPLVIGAGVLAGPIVRAEAALGWLLATTAVRPLTRVAARFLAASLAGAIAGLFAAASALLTVPVAPSVALQASCALVLWGACIGALASFVARRSAAAGKREGGLVVTGLSGLGIASLLAAGVLDAAALLLGSLAVAFAAAADTYEYSRAK